MVLTVKEVHTIETVVEARALRHQLEMAPGEEPRLQRTTVIADESVPLLRRDDPQGVLLPYLGRESRGIRRNIGQTQPGSIVLGWPDGTGYDQFARCDSRDTAVRRPVVEPGAIDEMRDGRRQHARDQCGGDTSGHQPG